MAPAGTILSVMLVAFSIIPAAYAHQVDSVGDYRLEIGWITEPAVSGETNGLELYVSELDAGLDATDQEFDPDRGITGLRKDIDLELVYKTDTIKLHVLEDHNVPGKYFGLVNPTVSGFYQLNIIGDIEGTPVSIAMHPPQVENQEYIAFPERLNEDILVDHDEIRSELDLIHQKIEDNKNSQYGPEIGLAGIGLGIAGIAIGATAIIRARR